MKGGKRVQVPVHRIGGDRVCGVTARRWTAGVPDDTWAPYVCESCGVDLTPGDDDVDGEFFESLSLSGSGVEGDGWWACSTCVPAMKAVYEAERLTGPTPSHIDWWS